MQINPEGIKFIDKNQTIKQDEVFDGAIMRIYANTIKLPNGSEVVREMIHHLPAVAVLAKLDDDHLILVKQYRPAVAQDVYEIPAGIIDIVEGKLEDPLIAAQRELEEETGYQAKSWREGASFYVSPGYLDEKITLFEAEGLYPIEQPLEQDLDEEVEGISFSRQELIDLMESGQIIDLKTLYAIQVWLNQS
ncbi:NUDIX hydrolase [Facklamia sp. DSM 111018]|uniref:NUDIX hydrolase n=1 Tax=Facklamia lactis TaxID=2749967 RepID=A0ABS0LNX9_9LACT|nr:NUDIX hydrolase [Facklamia lactis]MBG9979653.1 NUDIX hydrolase [Facklamia lactis]MBG9985667.1 NUDIX hydrolase [Facklamia lactis]